MQTIKEKIKQLKHWDLKGAWFSQPNIVPFLLESPSILLSYPRFLGLQIILLYTYALTYGGPAFFFFNDVRLRINQRICITNMDMGKPGKTKIHESTTQLKK